MPLRLRLHGAALRRTEPGPLGRAVPAALRDPEPPPEPPAVAGADPRRHTGADPRAGTGESGTCGARHNVESSPSLGDAHSRSLAVPPRVSPQAPQPCGHSIRRAWHDTPCAERQAYLNAVELLYKLPANNSLGVPNYATFVTVHAAANNSALAHGANDGPFLPWHRWYLWKFEKALQAVTGTCITVPYWDWSKDRGQELQSTVLKATSFGTSNGTDKIDGCLTNGLCSKYGFWKKTVRTGGCLKR